MLRPWDSEMSSEVTGATCNDSGFSAKGVRDGIEDTLLEDIDSVHFADEDIDVPVVFLSGTFHRNINPVEFLI